MTTIKLNLMYEDGSNKVSLAIDREVLRKAMYLEKLTTRDIMDWAVYQKFVHMSAVKNAGA